MKRFLKVLVLLVEILAIISSGFYIFLSQFWVIPWDEFVRYPVPIFLFIILPIIYISISLFVFFLTVKTKTFWLGRKLYQKLLFGFYLIVSLITIFITLFYAYIFFFNNNPPNFFPTDDPDATYIISKANDYYSLTYDSKSDKNSYTVCDVDDSGSHNCRTEVTRNFTVAIGKSNFDLEKYIGKPVSITGDFNYSTKQCILDKCSKEGGSRAVFDIYSIELVEK